MCLRIQGCPQLPVHLRSCGGSQVISTARTCNLILIVLDCLKPISHKRLIEHELEGFGTFPRLPSITPLTVLRLTLCLKTWSSPSPAQVLCLADAW